MERLRSRDNSLFPFFEDVLEFAPYYRKENQNELIQLADGINEDLQRTVFEHQLWLQEEGISDLVWLHYSDSPETVNTNRLDVLNKYDAWHTSELGRSAIAEELVRGARAVFQFVNFMAPE